LGRSATAKKKKKPKWGHAVAQLVEALRYCAGSIPDGVIGILHLGLTQPLTEMRTRNISWGQRRPVRKADNPTTLMCRLS